MSNEPILKGKHAVIFGASGSIGTAVAKSSRQKARRSTWPAERRPA